MVSLIGTAVPLTVPLLSSSGQTTVKFLSDTVEFVSDDVKFVSDPVKFVLDSVELSSTADDPLVHDVPLLTSVVTFTVVTF